MPYSGSGDKSLPSNVKDMPADKKKKWVAIFNSTYNSCVEDGGSTDSCETKAFKAANGAVKQGVSMSGQDRTRLQRAWEIIAEFLGLPVNRSIGYMRLREKLWQALDESEEWAYPIDIYFNEGNLFSLVAQGGKLYQIPMSMSGDDLTLGDWVQVIEDFKPVTQSRFFIRRQKDGTYRWTAIAGTTVLNRVGEIDSSELFDRFVEHAKRTGKYPRLDFYHLGETDPSTWEFGTADYLARDGVCYIASGTFDEGHPLAEATIKQCQTSDEWGNSIEFYAYSEAEILVVDPEVKVPVYKDGENTRISVVLEKDAAGLFTRMGVGEKVERAMDKTTLEALKKIFGEDEDAFNEFVTEVDTVNQTVKNERLIHRAKQQVAESAEDETAEEEQEDETSEEMPELVLDEAGLAVLAQQVMDSDHIKAPLAAVQQSIDELKALVAGLVEKREADSKEISRLKKANKTLTEAVSVLAQEDEVRQQTWSEDLPARRSVTVTYRPSVVHDTEESDEEDDSMSTSAERTLSKIPRAY